MMVLFDKIAVVSAPVEERKGLLYVPPSSDEGQIAKAVVVAVGLDVKVVKVDDVVFINRFTSHKVNIDGTDYLILTEKEVLVVK